MAITSVRILRVPPKRIQPLKIAPPLERITLFFQVTPEIKRFVHLYMIMGEKVHLVDAGVFGALESIEEKLAEKGRTPEEIASIFLTHSHPDHMGDAKRIRDRSGCRIYASEKEKPWIENIALQFQKRPIPNFHSLLPFSTKVDVFPEEGDMIFPEPGISLKVLEVPGHSQGSLAFLWQERGILFTGDAIPAEGDIPIYTDGYASIQSLEKLRALENITCYLPAWDEAYDGENGKRVLGNALTLLKNIDRAVRKAVIEKNVRDPDSLMDELSCLPEFKKWVSHPLFKSSIAANLKEVRKGV